MSFLRILNQAVLRVYVEVASIRASKQHDLEPNVSKAMTSSLESFAPIAQRYRRHEKIATSGLAKLHAVGSCEFQWIGYCTHCGAHLDTNGL